MSLTARDREDHATVPRFPKPISRSPRFAATLVITILALSPVATATRAEQAPGTSPPEPWRLTNRKRLELRFDPSEISRRRSAAAGTAPVQSPEHLIIDGRKNPELFLPWELFNSLVGLCYTGDEETRTDFRVAIRRNLRSLELPEGFWEDLETVASEFITSRQAQSSLAESLAAATPSEAQEIHLKIKELQALDCARRFRSLNLAQDHFGESFFLRFLYEGVAPEVALGTSTTTDRRDQLLFVQEGCQ
jgi:hypothetical protein